jgi:TolB protein
VRLAFVDVATGRVGRDRVIRLGDHFVEQLLSYFDQYALSHRLWSPDGASILLPLVDASGRDQLVVVPAGGADPRPIAGGAKGFWSP